ncbi:unnamed protein product, partial [Didymodactylos carnosus]
MDPYSFWSEQLTKTSTSVPHPNETEASGLDLSKNVVPFRILIKSLELLPSAVSPSLLAPYEVQFHATLYDGLYKRFYGQTWLSQWHKGKLIDNFFRVNFHEPLYFHIPISDEQNCLVLEFVFRSGEEGTDRQERTVGWTTIPTRTPVDDDLRPISIKWSLYHGSPRALMFMNEPVESNQRVLAVSSATLFVEIRHHQALFSVIQYLPECTIFGKGNTIGGIEFTNEGFNDALKQPQIHSKRRNIIIEHVEIDIEPSVNRFEDELCLLLNKDRIYKQDSSPQETRKISIVERRLRVGVHNGKCYVHDPLIFYLTIDQEDSALALSRKLSFKQSQRRRTVQGQDISQKIYLRNPIRLDDVALDSQNAIVFVLEYMVSIPLDKQKGKENEPNEDTKTTFTIRWAVWFPGKDKQVSLNFNGGQVLLTDELFVYKPSKTILNSPDIIRETLKFDYRFDDEQPMRYPTVTSNQELKSVKRDVSGRLAISFEDDQRSQLDTTQRSIVPARTIPSAFQPPVYHPSNLIPWNVGNSYPSFSPMLALAGQMNFAHSLSRATYAKLQGEKFPMITYINGKPAETIDIRQPKFMNIQTETSDPMNCNEIHLHFLAYQRTSSKQSRRNFPHNLFFTFKFYRFPEIITSRVALEHMHDDIPNDPNIQSYILWRLKEDNSKTKESPGLPVKFLIDGGFLGSDEHRNFFEYMNSHVLYIDVWDGDGIFCLGICALELKHLLRDGREAIQSLIELDIYSSVPVESTQPPEQAYHQYSGENQFSLIGEKLQTVGKLIMKIGNVGQVSEQPSIDSLKVPSFDIIQRRLGEISSTGFKQHNLTRAHRLVESYPNLNSVLHTQDKQAIETERLRKLSRMEAVRKKVIEGDETTLTPLTTNKKLRELRETDLRTISLYRHQTKHADIAHHLSNFITKELHISLMPGSAEFFEFVLQNPFSEQHSVSIACNDDEISVVTDAREWRKLKTMFDIHSETEESMFTQTDQAGLKYPQVFMRSKETIHIPFKIQTFQSGIKSEQYSQNSNPFTQEQIFSVVDKSFNERLKPKQIKVKDGTPIAILSIHIDYVSPLVDQTIRYINGENTLMKRVIRIPNPRRAIVSESIVTGLEEQLYQSFVKPSDPNVICDIKPVPISEPCDMLVK